MNDERIHEMEHNISSLLRLGVTLSGMLIFTGLLLYYFTGNQSCPYGVLTMEWILWGDPFHSPSHILFLGFLTLVATPLIRVLASTIVYYRDKDIEFTILTGVVSLILLTSIILGIG